MPEIEILFETQWIRVLRQGRWHFVRRPQSTSAVGILAVTPDNEIVLVEQFRIPIGNTVIELPAGIVGDEEEFLDESLEGTARRELMEETGYRAGTMQFLIRSPATPGLADEFMNLFLATGLIRETEGGGTEHEEIIVHHVQVAGIRGWLAAKQAEGHDIDARVYAALWLANIAG
jgi:ADP-ribose pyrophosphatase